MVFYELKKKRIWVKYKDRYEIKRGVAFSYRGDKRSESCDTTETISQTHIKSLALDRLSDYRSYVDISNPAKLGREIEVTEYYVEENEYDAYGEWIGKTDVDFLADMEFEVVEFPNTVKAVFDNYKDAEEYWYKLEEELEDDVYSVDTTELMKKRYYFNVVSTEENLRRRESIRNHIDVKKKIIEINENSIFHNWQEHSSITKEDFIEALEWVCKDRFDDFNRCTRQIGLEPDKIVKLKVVYDAGTWLPTYFNIDGNSRWEGAFFSFKAETETEKAFADKNGMLTNYKKIMLSAKDDVALRIEHKHCR
jgi:hypothetical protein